jgi:hypothetical protein
LAATPSAPADVEGFPLADVISQVKRELAAAQAVPATGLGLTLHAVEVKLALNRVKSVNGEVGIGVPFLEVAAGGKRDTRETSSLYVKLAPPSPQMLMAGKEETLGLADAIIETRQQLQKGVSEEPRLDPVELKIDLLFGLTHAGGPKAKFKFLIFSAGGGAQWSLDRTSQISLIFKKDEAP